MRIVVAALVIILLAMVWRLNSVNATVARQQEQIQRLNFTNTKECAAQADRLVSRFGLDHCPDNRLVNDRENHYSPTFGRCYVRLVRDRALDAFKYRSELWDGFEQRLVATCEEVPEFPVGCRIEEGGRGNVDCAACRSFISERMSK